MTMVETVVYPETKVIQLSTKTLIEKNKTNTEMTTMGYHKWCI